MTSLKEIDIVYALTAPDAEGDVAALVAYLRSRKNYLDDALANLLDENVDSAWRLKLVCDNRHMDDAEIVERKAAAFQRVRELTGSKADRAFVDDIVKGLQAKWWRGSFWKVEPRKASWLLQENGHTIASVPAGKPLTEAVAKKIAAAEHGFTYGTFRDVYRDIERVIRAE